MISKKMQLFIATLLFVFVATSDAYKFLVYSPNFGKSHTRFMGKLADVLAKGGHNVTLLMPVIDRRNRQNTGTKLVKHIIYKDAGEEAVTAAMSTANFIKSVWTDEESISTLFKQWPLGNVFSNTCKTLLQDAELLAQIKAENFDVGFAEPFTFCGFGLFEILGINRTIATISSAVAEGYTQYTGQPRIASFVPALYSSDGDKLSAYQRFKNGLYSYFGTNFYDQIFEAEYEVFLTKYGTGFKKTLGEILGQASLVYENSHPYLNFPQPKLQKTIDIGGFAVDLSPEAIGKLDEKWEAVLNERQKTVLVSFGSVAKSMDMPEEWKKSLLKVFESMPEVTFIWKYEAPTKLADHLPNVHISSWLPQNALLADDRLSLFITHGGLASTTEVAHLGVPAISVGLFADQGRNGAMLARHGGAVAYDKFDLGKPKKLKKTIQKLLNDERYSQNARKLAEMLKERSVNTHDLIVKNAELVAKFGPLTALDAEGRHLSFIEYYLIDVLLYAILLTFVLLYGIKTLLSSIYCRIMIVKKKSE